MDIFRCHSKTYRVAFHVVEEPLYGLHECIRIHRQLTALEQQQQIESVGQQIPQALRGRHIGRRSDLCATGRQRRHRAGGGGQGRVHHKATATSSIFSSAIPAGT